LILSNQEIATGGIWFRGQVAMQKSRTAHVGEWDGPAVLPSLQQASWQGAPKTKEHAMSENFNSEIAVIGIDIGKNSFHIVGQDRRGSIVLRQKWSRGQLEARLAHRSKNISILSPHRPG
jgi:hypothetical protein